MSQKVADIKHQPFPVAIPNEQRDMIFCRPPREDNFEHTLSQKPAGSREILVIQLHNHHMSPQKGACRDKCDIVLEISHSSPRQINSPNPH